MQIKDVRPETIVKQISCDRCGRLADASEAEFQEFISIELKAGYGSIFGDGCDVQVDLCQYCLNASIGRWLRISNADSRSRRLEDLLRRFDPKKLGGEFPEAKHVSLKVPEDFPQQERSCWTTSPTNRHRLAKLSRNMQTCMRQLIMPMIWSIRINLKACQRLARLERVRQRRHEEFIDRGRASIDSSEAAGD